MGGCGFKVLVLLEGNAHGYIFACGGCKRWDTCAPEALLRCVGGKLTGLDGREYCYSRTGESPINSMGVLATPDSAWLSAYLQRIPPSLVDSL